MNFARMLLLLALASPAASAWAMNADAGAATNLCEGEDKVVVDALDPAVEAQHKAAAVQAMQTLAAGGCADAAYVVGNMLRFGPDLPGNPLPKDVAGAARLLEQAGLGGQSHAFADLAELALAENMPREAMLWTQVHLWRIVNRPSSSPGTPYRRQGYDADLLQRATNAWHHARLDNALIQSTLDAYVASHRAQLTAGERDTERYLPTRARLSIARRPAPRLANMGPHAGYVLFLLEVQPSGEVTRMVVESFGPTPDIVGRLRPLAEGVRLHPFEGTGPQNGVLPIVYGFDGPFSPALR